MHQVSFSLHGICNCVTLASPKINANWPLCSDMAERTVSVLTRRSAVATIGLKTDVKCRRFHFYKRCLCNIVVLLSVSYSRSAICCLTAINTGITYFILYGNMTVELTNEKKEKSRISVY